MRFEREEIELTSGAVSFFVAGSGSPTLYVHGGEGVQISEALLRLSERRRIYLPVLPGFDATPPHENVGSVRQLGRLLGEFIDRKIGGPCDVIGHSFGGWVAMWLAVQDPDRVDHLVLEAPIGFVEESRKGVIGAADIRTARLYAHPERATLAPRDDDLARGNRLMLARYAGDTEPDKELLAALSGLTKVTLLLAGAADTLAAPSSMRLLKSMIPKSYLVYVYDAAHVVEVDQPTRFLRVVGDFLEWGEAFLVNRADQRVPGRVEDAAPAT